MAALEKFALRAARAAARGQCLRHPPAAVRQRSVRSGRAVIRRLAASDVLRVTASDVLRCEPRNTRTTRNPSEERWNESAETTAAIRNRWRARTQRGGNH